MKRLQIVTLSLLLLLGSVAQAQLLAEVQTTAALALTLNPAVSLPPGSVRAVGPGAQDLIDTVPGAETYTDWEVYTATGVTARLQPAFVQQVVTSFASSGYLLASQQEEQVGNQTRIRYSFENTTGSSTLLYVIRTPNEFVWLVAEEE
ncbi:MAG: hypothetical protein U5L04_06265 [Trueperaceae bacterium]|nr:hypothetical protein [Trueperaceae bacterium]